MEQERNQSSQDTNNIPNDVEIPIGKDDVTEGFKAVQPLPESTRPRKDGPGGE